MISDGRTSNSFIHSWYPSLFILTIYFLGKRLAMMVPERRNPGSNLKFALSIEIDASLGLISKNNAPNLLITIVSGSKRQPLE